MFIFFHISHSAPRLNHLVTRVGWWWSGPLCHVSVGDGAKVAHVRPLHGVDYFSNNDYMGSRGLKHIAEVETPRPVDLQQAEHGWTCVDAACRVIRSGGLDVPTLWTPKQLASWCMIHGRITSL